MAPTAAAPVPALAAPVHRRTVVTLHDPRQGRAPHELASADWLARRLASLFGWGFAGVFDPGARYPDRPYFVPADTLLAEDAARLGIVDEHDLFGGVVPHAFVATKVISHAAADPASVLPTGWQPGLSAALGDAVLPGHAAFGHAGLEAASLQLLRHGPVRIKQAHARGGHGQDIVEDAHALRQVCAGLDPVALREHGVVAELNLDQATTCSIGELRLPGMRLAYLGTQRQIVDRTGGEVYGGSSLRVVRGGFADLDALAGSDEERQVVRNALRYDAAVQQAFPGFFASRRNYDAVCGVGGDGRRHCGILEQSWRLGGASPAEIAALAALLAMPGLARVDAACHESHDPAHIPPTHAQVHFSHPDATEGPVMKYATVDIPDGHIA